MAEDLILSIGHVAVENGEIVSSTNTYLNWPDSGLVEPAWLSQRMERTRAKMAEKGVKYQMDFETLREKGVPPLEAFQAYHDLFSDCVARGDSFVTHNGYRFDIPWLKHNWNRWLGKTFSFGENRVWDTGVIEKACQVQAVPEQGDTMFSWSSRVGGMFLKGVYFALDRHCVPKYGLAEKHALDMSNAHGAGYDCYVTSLLFREYRNFLETSLESKI